MNKNSIACIAFDDKKVLIAHRQQKGQMGGRWEFPGGKVEDGETCEEAIKREFKEEFGVEAEPVKKIAEAVFLHDGDNFTLHGYLIRVPHNGLSEKYTLTEHSEYKWVEVAEIPMLNFVDSDMLIYPQVVKFLADSL